MKSKYTFKTIILLVYLIITHAAFGIPRWNVTFNGMTTSQTPTYTAAVQGQINSQPTDPVLQTGGTILVQSSFTAGSANLSDTPVVFTHTTNATPVMYFNGNSGDYQRGAGYKLEFDLIVSSTSAANTLFGCMLYDVNSVQIGYVAFGTSSMRTIIGNTSTETYFYNTWQTNTLTHVAIVLDTDAGQLKCSLNGVSIGYIALSNPGAALSVSKVEITGGSTSGRGTFAIDNIKTTDVVPMTIQPLWNVNFNSMTANADPATYSPDTYPQTAKDVITKPTTVTYGASTTIKVQSSFTAGQTLSDKPVVFTDSSTSNSARLEFKSNPNDFAAPQDFQLEFDILISSSALSSGTVAAVDLLRNGTSTPTATFGYDNNAGTHRILLMSQDIGKTTQYKYCSFNWSTNAIQHCKLYYDSANAKFKTWINSSYVGDINVVSDLANRGIRTFAIYTNSAPTATFAVDNIMSRPIASTPVVFDNTTAAELMDATNYFDISSIKLQTLGNRLAGWDSGDSAKQLFKIVFEKTDHSGTQTITNHTSCANKSWQTTISGTKPGLQLFFNGFDLGGLSQQVNVTVTLLGSKINSGIEWYISVSNANSQYSVDTVDFPYLRLRPGGNTPTDDQFIYSSQDEGNLIYYPYDNPQTIWQKYKLWYNGGLFEYPYPLMMPWMAIYDPAVGGLYMAAHDPDGYEKGFFIKPIGGAFDLNLEYFAPFAGGATYAPPFPFVTEYTAGTWYDGSQAYRTWVVNQPWMVNGPLSTRTDVPKWYKDAPAQFAVYSITGTSISDITKAILAYKDFFGIKTPLPLIWYNWMLWRPEDSSCSIEEAGTLSGYVWPAKAQFAQALELLTNYGIFTQPYENARIFDVPNIANDYPTGWRANSMKDCSGNPILWDSSSIPGGYDMCPSTSLFRSNVANICTQLAQNYYAKGAYLDQFGSLYDQCFDATHGHQLGGGNWQYVNMRAMADQIKSSTKAVEPNAVFSMETGADMFLEKIDGNLIYPDISPYRVGMLPAVYGGYWPTYGRMLFDYLGDSTEFKIVAGDMFIYGLKLGRLNVGDMSFLTNPAYRPNMNLLRELIRYRYSARSFLQYGTMLRPITFQNALPNVSYHLINADWPSPGVDIIRPTIMSSVWQDPNGNAGIVLFNISGSDQTFNFTLNSINAPVLSNNSVTEWQYVRSDGAKQLNRVIANHTASYNSTLHANEIRIYALTNTSGYSNCTTAKMAGYNSVADLNGDCVVNTTDYNLFAQQWLYCNTPQDPNCGSYWNW